MGRDFRLLWLGETASALGSSVTSIALPLVALTSLHAGIVAVSLLSAAAWLPWLLIGLPAGAWVDRLRRRPVMVACDAASLVLFASVPIAGWLGLLTMPQLLAVALLTGVAKVFFSTAYRAFLPAVVDETELVTGNSRLMGAESAAQVAGPGLGGVLAQVLGAATALLADALSFLVSLLCLRAIRSAEPAPSIGRRALRAEIGEGLRAVRGDRMLWVFMTFGGTANLVLTGYGAIEVAFLVRGLGLGAGGAGLAIAAGQLGGVAGALLAPAVAGRIGSARALRLFKIGAASFGLLIPLAAPGWGLGLFVVGSLGLVGGIVAGNVVTSGWLQAYCPTRLMGRITTTMQVVNYGSIPLGAVLGGVLAGAFGFRPALWLLFAGLVASSLILFALPVRGRRDLPSRPAPHIHKPLAEVS